MTWFWHLCCLPLLPGPAGATPCKSQSTAPARPGWADPAEVGASVLSNQIPKFPTSFLRTITCTGRQVLCAIPQQCHGQKSCFVPLPWINTVPGPHSAQPRPTLSSPSEGQAAQSCSALEGWWEIQPLPPWPISFQISTGWQLPFAWCYHLPSSSSSSWWDFTWWLFQMYVTRIPSAWFWFSVTEMYPKVSTESHCSCWALYFSFFFLMSCKVQDNFLVLEKNTNNRSFSIFSLLLQCS